jgi:hypothetical protein
MKLVITLLCTVTAEIYFGVDIVDSLENGLVTIDNGLS